MKADYNAKSGAPGNMSGSVPDRNLYEYAVVRYVPRVDRQEFINVGLIMMSKRRRWIRGAIWIDESRLRAFDPHVDIPRLCRQLTLFEDCEAPGRDLPVEERYRWLVASKSAVIQTSPSHPGFAEDPDVEFDRLLADLVKPPAL